ncbi:hypothetical protein CCP3SC1_130006 [Gammaproteobacteria bacterium]
MLKAYWEETADKDSSVSVVGNQRLASCTILTVEDHEINRLVSAEILHREGVHFGRLAVDRIQRDGANAWDIVFMDI